MTEPQIMMAALPFPNIDPVLFSIGPLSVHWYGIGYVIGILFAWWYGKKLVNTARLWPNNNAPMDPLALDDFVLWAALGVVIGGRLGYVLFYNFGFYISNPLEIPAVWDGGMSFHGGILGTTVAMILFARKRGIPVWSMFDTIAAGVPIGLGVVRIANFINSELWGRVSDVSWAVYFPNGGPLPRHPSQLYEAALEGFVLFCVLALLIWKGNKLKAPGFIAGAFVAGYGLSRILVEFFREPDAQLGYLVGGWMTMGMVLSVPMVLLGVWAMWRGNRAAAKA
ncbi:prolipoprotein diacylglyceryl transferase [Pseudochrobactrum algeriensis]|uniref:prolipoprotein diacylglyceryl transferase n=1 Tax=Pseudochrobactrum TaxID=354349 RepID=UPI001BCC9E6F|nr:MULTISPECIES: prolipoprotein diacylglyceryl transferase [Pseudochrobactrum]MBX8811594.1 prolipoprotein diacylglyceryl transferase [Ochrobactrum sp. MR34]MDP8250162.1 prolipoprotein diacylglyceryl transferase [Pseudochrobactrum saccharolyticum]QVQ35952.1 prolipoprotein diacylglyceryl transferase [Pseudochrobactrum algeriensis]QVQ39171.1 prolipoprotein diacylglyceryl transferase [Pseudochrobactrum algeriensis]QVQ43090.1 prolipoprotein diacylglyceryl transferase [Pseudochrobactrum algeriensis]